MYLDRCASVSVTPATAICTEIKQHFVSVLDAKSLFIFTDRLVFFSEVSHSTTSSLDMFYLKPILEQKNHPAL